MTTEVGGVQVVLPGVLAELIGGIRQVTLPTSPGTLADVLDALAVSHPTLVRRLRDETGALRRHVNIYLDGVDVRGAAGLATRVDDHAVLQVLLSVAGG